MNLHVTKLRCEYKENPLDIDVLKPRFSWQIQSDSRDILQASYQIQVAVSETGFTRPLWDTGRVESDQSIHVVYDGPCLTSRTRYSYRVKVWEWSGHASEWSEVAFFETAMMKEEEWFGHWITAEPILNSEACHYLRREFVINANVKSARVYVTALGLYELHCDGEKVGDWVMTPGWTSYHHQLQYQTYDITEKLSPGTHALGLVIGNGWYRGRLTWLDRSRLYGDKRAALLQLHIEYQDGRVQVIASDGEWMASTGPILMSEIYDGETYDARLEMQGWSEPGFRDVDWAAVEILDLPQNTLMAQVNNPSRVVEEIHPVELIRTPSGDTVIDLGQNMVGWMKFRIQAEQGTVLTLEHAEVLDKDGEFYTENLRSAKQTIAYICRGGGTWETYEPHFTFQGFRYVRVTGHPGELSLEQFVGCVVHTDFERTGEFECFNLVVNQLQHNIVWGQKGNFLDVPTDCPQRDERLGWTGDAQVFIRTAAFNYDVALFFTKWLRDLKADQAEDGSIPFVIPDVLMDTSTVFGQGKQTSAAWGDAAVICPWTLYLSYGDKRVLSEQYDSMKRWIEYIRSQGDNEFLWNTGFHFGDWLGLDAKENSYVGATPKDLIATAFYAFTTRILKDTAVVLGKSEDVEYYAQLLKDVVNAFREEFVTVAGRVAAPTQTAHVLVLMFDLVDGDIRRRVARDLNEMIVESDYHLTTGFVGTPYLCHVLSNNGYHETAVKLLLQESYPGWLYSISKGATTVWEHWDGIKPDGSFWSKDMNSYNHYAYGAVGDWLYRVVAGIDTDDIHNPGYKHICIKPHPTTQIPYVKASLETMYGRVFCHWEYIEDTRLKITVKIPANTTAAIVLPYATTEMVKDSLERLGKEGIHLVESLADSVRVEVGSGDYEFVYDVMVESPQPVSPR